MKEEKRTNRGQWCDRISTATSFDNAMIISNAAYTQDKEEFDQYEVYCLYKFGLEPDVLETLLKKNR